MSAHRCVVAIEIAQTVLFSLEVSKLECCVSSVFYDIFLSALKTDVCWLYDSLHFSGKEGIMGL